MWSSRSGCFTSMERTVVSVEVEAGCLKMRRSHLSGILTGPPARSVVTISTMLPWLQAVISLDSEYYIFKFYVLNHQRESFYLNEY